MSKEYILYAHGGSRNHGCEAIVRSTLKILKKEYQDIIVMSFRPQEDLEFGLDEICKIERLSENIKNYSLKHIMVTIPKKFFNIRYPYYNAFFKNYFMQNYDNKIAFSIGGDHYCYEGYERYSYFNTYATNKGVQTVLWGCSIEPGMMRNEILEDINCYSLIITRESITYNALLYKGINQNIYLFTSDRQEGWGGIVAVQ